MENRKLWVAALRSDEYTQGAGCLKTADGNYCCLGVLCKIAGIQEVHPRNNTTLYDGNDTLAPQSAMDFVGLRDSGGEFDNNGTDIPQNSLWNLNDGFNTQEQGFVTYSFKDIADIIEQEPKGLFINV